MRNLAQQGSTAQQSGVRTKNTKTEAESLERWGDLRGNVDEALKLLGMLPNAIATKDEDHFLEEVMTRLSGELVCIDVTLGNERPGAEQPEFIEQFIAIDLQHVLSEANNGLERLQIARDEVFAF